MATLPSKDSRTTNLTEGGFTKLKSFSTFYNTFRGITSFFFFVSTIFLLHFMKPFTPRQQKTSLITTETHSVTDNS